MGKVSLILVFLLLLGALNIQAQNFGGNPSSIKWKQINSKQVRVIFPAGSDSQANRIHNIAEMLNGSTAGSIGGRIRKWNIILQNQTTIPNAYVRLAPVMSELYMIPGQDNFQNGSIRWDDNLIIHEDRHIEQFSNFNKGFTKVFSFLFGQEGQLLANGMTIPNYFFEGDAVWQETLVSAQGRGRMPAFYNGFKALWQSNKNYSWMKLRSGSYKDFVPDHYPLGYQLVAYGYETYGEDFWKRVTDDAVRFKGVFYSFNRAIEKYSGKRYEIFRNDALAWFKARSFPATKSEEAFSYVTGTQKNNVIDYLFPNYISDDAILITRQSYREPAAFYIIKDGKEKKLRIKNTVIDEYYSYNAGKIVYASFQSDPRCTNRNYSVLQLVDVKTGEQKQLTYKSKYFSPDINQTGTEIIAVQVSPDGTNSLNRLDARTGALTRQLPNPHNYFFTQTKYIDASNAVSAVRNPEGQMALIKIDLSNGETNALTPFSFNVLGYPFVKDNLIYFSAMNENADKVFVVDIISKKISRVTNNSNAVYHPVINSRGEMLVSAFTADGYRLVKLKLDKIKFQEISPADFAGIKDLYTPKALKAMGAGILYTVKEQKLPVTKYHKSFRLFNFHSARPVLADPEYGYSIYGDNVLSSFSNSITYTFNRNELSHNIEYNAAYAGWYPVVSVGLQGAFNRNLDTALGKSVNFNSAKLNASVYVPLRFVGGRTNKFLTVGAGFNAEQLYYPGVGKNIFSNRTFDYGNLFLSFSNINRQARQQVNPRWAQTFQATYRHAFTMVESRKFVSAARLYFPGIFSNHSIVLDGAFQKRDTLPDIFSNTFSYSRGYLGLSTRQMYKVGINYQLPLFYPDWGFGNIVFFQRIRGNAFYDHTIARARVNNMLTDITNRSTGAEIFFDTKIWNALPVSFGVRYARLLDTDLRNTRAVNRWEFIVPIGLLSN